MNTLKMLLLPLICLLSTATFAQDRTQVVCKGSPVPEGYAISGETISDSCNGTAWIIKPKAGPRSMLDRFNSAASNPVSLVERNEVISPGQCDAFRQTVASTYNFNPERMSEEQIKAQSARLDVFWNQVRQSRGLLVPCLRKALEQETSGSFFNIDGSMLLVDIEERSGSFLLQRFAQTRHK